MNRHFILTHGRSGSNFLVNSINQHPNLVNYGEVLGDWTIPYRIYKWNSQLFGGLDQYLQSLYKGWGWFYLAQIYSVWSHIKQNRKANFKFIDDVSNIGIKDFAFLMKKRGIANYLKDHKDIKVVFLERKNHLKRYVSLLNMQIYGIVKTERQTNKTSKIIIDIPDMLLNLNLFKNEEALGHYIIQGIPDDRILKMYYEEYFFSLENIIKINKAIFRFLGVSELDIFSKQKKILSNKLSECIYNYDQVHAVLKNTDFEFCLD